MLSLGLILLLPDARGAAPAELAVRCQSMWTSQPLEGYLGVADADGVLRTWSEPVPTGGVSVWVCVSRPAYAWLWRVQADNTPVLVWPLGGNVVQLEPGVPTVLPQASLIGAQDARSLLLALSPTPERPAAVTGFAWMSPGVDPVVKLALPTWPGQPLWEPIRLGPPTSWGRTP